MNGPLTRNCRCGPLFWGMVIVLLIGAALPFFVSSTSFVLMLASYALIAGLVALSLDMLMGNTGLISFGHAAWYGLGAYRGGITAKCISTEIVAIILAAIAGAALLSAIIGFILVRKIGKAFAILTLAFSQIVYAIIFLAPAYTGGEDGLQGVPPPTIFGTAIVDFAVWYWLLFGTAVVSIALALYLRRSPLGQAWLAIKENQERARFIGINVYQLKLISYVISASFAAWAGALFVLFSGGVAPDMLHWFESGKIMMYVILGGVGTFVGPVIGAIVFTFVQNFVSSLTDAWLIYFGGFIVLMVIFAPGGIYGVAAAITRRVQGYMMNRRTS